MVEQFRHLGNSSLVFGNGRLGELPSFLEGKKRILIVTGNHFPETSAWEKLEKKLADVEILFLRETVSGEPSPEIVDDLTALARREKTEAVVAIGGGSVLDAGKAIAAMLCHHGSVFEYLEGVGTREPSGESLPMIAIPTTAGTGSEATKNAVISRRGPGGFKKSLRHDAFIPGVALIDPELAVGCPPGISLACGMDAFSQLLESFVSTGSTAISDILARSGLIHFTRGSRLFTEKRYGSEEEADDRGELALAAYFSGLTLANAGLGTVHGIAGPLGAVCEVPHGAACGLLAPPVFRKITAALRENDPGSVLNRLAWVGAILSRGGNSTRPVLPESGDVDRLLDILDERASALPKLSRFGLTEGDLDRVVAASGNKNSPVSLSKEEMKAVLTEVL